MKALHAPGAAALFLSRRGKSRKSDKIRARRAATSVYFAAAIPVMILFGSLGVDSNYISAKRTLLRNTTMTAAVAGGQQLATYYSSGSGATIQSTATSFAALNMPSSVFGNVVTSANVVLGNWDASTKTFTSLTTSGGTSPNAVKVIGNMTTANGNALSLPIGAAYGLSKVEMSDYAISAPGKTGAMAWNTIILNDLSQSFAPEIANQRTMDTNIVSCIAHSASSASKVGITTFDGHANTSPSWQQLLTPALANETSLNTAIAGMNACGTGGSAPSCSGSNVASGLYSAISQYNSSTYNNSTNGSVNNIILITDGVPNASSTSYSTADGIYPSGNSGGGTGAYISAVSGTAVCSGTNCTDNNLLTMAQNQATIAGNAKMSISVIYFTATTSSGSLSTYVSDLQSLVKNNGVYLSASSAAAISSQFAAYCSTMGSVVVSNN